MTGYEYLFQYKDQYMDEWETNFGGSVDGDWIFDSMGELFQTVAENPPYDTDNMEYRIVKKPKGDVKEVME